ncbi:HISTIDINE KINASE [Carpediemonas membranifera]|uniref:histidine kinase n=1 Tax=Carpediemonas membranifera TaxID=201153 RepID=A0A8J6BCN1_9EUKA|nr:HISTIDINE KINASE [Carpediemonas membranifera]|eukprot:KAG9397427.1 HISTIDINE KINASE [Carpediemonas membranifera]
MEDLHNKSYEHLLARLEQRKKRVEVLRRSVANKQASCAVLLDALCKSPILCCVLSSKFEFIKVNASVKQLYTRNERSRLLSAVEHVIGKLSPEHTKAVFYDTISGPDAPIRISWTVVASYSSAGRLRRAMMIGSRVNETSRKRTELLHNWQRDNLPALPKSFNIYQMMDLFRAEGFFVMVLGHQFPQGYRLLMVSKVLEDIWGSSAEELCANPFAWAKAIHPDDYEATHAVLIEFIRGDKEQFRVRHRVISKATGAVRWVQAVATAFVDDVGVRVQAFGSVTDVTEIVEEEEKAERTKEKMEQLTKYADAVLWVASLRDSSYKLQYVSNAWTRWTGLSSEEIVGDNDALQLTLPEDQAEWLARRLKFFHQGRSGLSVMYDLHNVQTGEVTTALNTAVLLRNSEGDPVASVGIAKSVTELVRAQDKLKEVNEMFVQMAETIDNAWFVTVRVFKDPDGNIVDEFGNIGSPKPLHVTRSCYDIFELTADELINTPGAWHKHIDPDELPTMKREVKEYYTRAIDDPATASFDYIHKLKMPDGRIKYALIRSKPILNSRGELDGFAGTISDVSKIVQIQRDLADYIEKSNQIMDNIETIIVLFQIIPEKHDIQINLVSRYFERFTGHPISEVLNKNLATWLNLVVHPADRQFVSDQVFEFEATHDCTRHFQQRMLRVDGSTVYADVKFTRVEGAGEGGFDLVVGTLTDITEIVTAHNDLNTIEQQMHKTQKLESLGVLSEGIACDLKDLLMIIVGNADLALEMIGDTNKPVRILLLEIIEAVTKSNAFTDQLLSYAGKGKYFVSELNLSSAIGLMQGFLMGLNVPDHITVHWNLAPETQLPLVAADKVQLAQVLLALITNGIEAIGTQSGTITVSTGFDTERDKVFVRVADTGCGMPVEVRERMFDPFYSTKFTGRGLGMATVKGIVDTHHGAIEIDSSVGSGTIVTVFFRHL